MRKLYVICTTLVLAVNLVHMVNMGLWLYGVSGLSYDFAIILGYSLIGLAALHGIYGLFKWVKVLAGRRRLKKLNGRKAPGFTVSAAKVTLVQRITGVLIVVLLYPHMIMWFPTANVLQTIIAIVFVLSIVVHLLIGIPKWLVSAGLIGGRLGEKLSAFYGGTKNA